MSRELLAAQPGDDVVLAHGAAQALGHRAEDLVPLGVAVSVVDRLEVVEVEGDDRERALELSGAGDLLAQALVAGAMVQRPGEPVRARLLAQRVALAGGVEGERGHGGEALDLGDLRLLEGLVLADPVDVEGADDAVLDQQRHGDERLGLHQGALDHGRQRLAVRALDVARAAIRHHPARDALRHREHVGQHLVGVDGRGRRRARASCRCDRPRRPTARRRRRARGDGARCARASPRGSPRPGCPPPRRRAPRGRTRRPAGMRMGRSPHVHRPPRGPP